MISTNYIFDQPINLTNCDREPIHVPNAIQPHGILLICNKENWQITHVSDNTEFFLGYLPHELLNQSLNQLLNAEDINAIAQCLERDFETINPLNLKILNSQQATILFYGIVHRSPDNLLILELETCNEDESYDFFQFSQLTRHLLTKIQNVADLSTLSQLITKEIREITGFDRVMVYRFDDDGSGAVIAETKHTDLTSYLGLHYPDSDIPKQAKQLYHLNKLRLIPNVNYHPAALISNLSSLTQSSPDLSLSILRSVSPLHIEYLQNMQVGASMSISLLKNNRLWGLISCHHRTTKYLSYHLRTFCELIGQLMSIELSNKEEQDNLTEKIQLKILLSDFVDKISESEDFVDVLTKNQESLLPLVKATGVAIISHEVVLLGETPLENQIHRLIDWVLPHLKNNLYYTDSLPEVYPPAEQFKDLASGIIVVSITKLQRNLIIWFRPEVIQTVNWGGEPDKEKNIDADGNITLSPRKSFEKWQEIVKFKSLPWQKHEVEAVMELRSVIIGIILKKADELALINEQLQDSNNELDAFAYIASHDLKEPLRGIHNYANFLLEDYGHQLDADGVHKLDTLMLLTTRMENLINALLHFSRLSRAELRRNNLNLNKLVENVFNFLRISQYNSQINIKIAQDFPIVEADRILLEEIYTNLISNSIKYNEQPEKQIEIGWTIGKPEWSLIEHPCFQQNIPIFYVKDNGIGIREKHLDTIFRIFKRLHGQSQYRGGTGAGLTIVKKIVERHGGQIWVESKLNQGTIFYFTLVKENEN
ncbi:GAF domain-containing protein [Anabaena cylindrica FACHB-243]|uniref:histidine kinase n=1 Tax=Anabaena cylindrica (strain ATCC 27899 / PCC 7122) TaxID=272123 RepID=K9ZKZ3_ANACC|nr:MULTISPECIES: ATP-binding protein [Anabaena]AFZ59918.1 multi-sensor signal transduction histidine kinase [Anabaena cylindrica PCC 7122]MBD2416747.1 GAF domain-containing protein [Anabaena cylindrica FACHB-243]MBY5284596.1 GAF domain-containing protein [Anabaena sp. CCAP 1446/1C]MBY5311812.1 GAF domain-containing protein [Anabaena sp. CCAP 1446/1C]MCM2409832.1 ATP-binding protein [Anabaena sp. CCAP 1446/1C]